MRSPDEKPLSVICPDDWRHDDAQTSSSAPDKRLASHNWSSWSNLDNPNSKGTHITSAYALVA